MRSLSLGKQFFMETPGVRANTSLFNSSSYFTDDIKLRAFSLRFYLADFRPPNSVDRCPKNTQILLRLYTQIAALHSLILNNNCCCSQHFGSVCFGPPGSSSGSGPKVPIRGSVSVPKCHGSGTLVAVMGWHSMILNSPFKIVTLIGEKDVGAVAWSKIVSLEILTKIQFKLAPTSLETLLFTTYFVSVVRIWNFLTRIWIRALERDCIAIKTSICTVPWMV